ncbi:SusC/RagA family TonB-linked outer membrane protein [Algoriphagus machipongonensis]|uniref:Outer membrane protein, probably involved in nutrient binding n=1 Tax=Algoriphagus machipongonensis TaxID=388413 RepID=A3I0L8_9BACT|nr:SusC/RagA family TonB-linked outer membrane protein [Algoriphagus machipongonensis]EAZ80014.1 putative outer membrane protein, probably involved in nutrient binding [Algoriphagus machipongonensis]
MRKVLSISFTLVFMLGLIAIAQAQDRVVKGVVTADGLPMPGVTILDKSNQKGTTTNVDGEYSITVGANSVLVFSFIGYDTQEVTVGNQSEINVNLEENTSELDEFVVTAFGMDKKEKSLGYATSTIVSDDLIKTGTPNVVSALYGKAPGVRIASGAGGATSAVNIQIRGINSITGKNQPLIVLDGVPIRNEEVSNNNYWGDQRLRGNGLLDINPADVENISILKGASAAALYGSEAVNGVVLITTKKGKVGRDGMQVDFNANVTMDEIAYLPRYQNVRGPGFPNHVANLGQAEDGFNYTEDGIRTVPNTTNNFGPEFDGQPMLAWDGISRPYNAQEDNYAALFNSPISSQINVAISNATEKSNFRLSLTRQDNEALSLNSKNSKNIVNLNASYNVSKRIKTDLMINYINQNTKNRPYSIDRMINNFGGMMTRFDNGAWYLDKYQTSRGYRFVTGNGQSLTPDENITGSGFLSAIADYAWRVNKNLSSEKSNRVIGSLTNHFQITNDLKLRARISTDFTNRYNENSNYSTRPLAFGPSGGFGMSTELFSILYGDLLLSYTKSITDEISVSAMAGYTARRESFRSIGRSTNGGLSTENLFDIVASTNIPNSSSDRTNRVIDAFLGTVNFDYKNIWFVEGTIRRDRVSTMNPDNNAFIYPSVNTSFAISDAITLPQFITFSKLRGSWGIVGNYPDVYRANIAYNQNSLGEQQPGGANVLYTNLSSSFGNDGIKPEQKHEFEFGLDTRFFNNRFGLDISYYNAQIRDQILPLTLPNSSGASSVLTNIGTLRNTGVEVGLNGAIVQTPDFNWNMTLNIAKNVNKVEKLANNATELLHADYDGNAAQLRSVVGRPMGDFFAHPIERDDNGNKIVQPNGLYKIDADNWIQVGNAMPDAVGGIINEVSYKNFSLYAVLDFQIGGSVMPTGINWMISRGLTEASLNNMNEERGGLAYYQNADGQGVQVDHSTAQGPNGETVYHDGMLMDGVVADGSTNSNVISQAIYYNSTYNWGGPQYSQSRYELYIQDNDYLKMRELSLSYNIPPHITDKIGASNVNISVFGRNLFFLYRNIKDLDPEVLTGGSRWTQTLTSAGTNPATRTFGVKLNARF